MKKSVSLKGDDNVIQALHLRQYFWTVPVTCALLWLPIQALSVSLILVTVKQYHKECPDFGSVYWSPRAIKVSKDHDYTMIDDSP